MKAIQMFSYGEPDVLRLTDVDRPEPGPGEVQVAVEATSVNGHDVLVRAGTMKIVSGRRFPVGTGLDFAGTVTALGPGVTGMRIDEPVWGIVHPRRKHALAAAAEYVVVPADRIAPRPASQSAAEAVALLVPGITALTALRTAARVHAGDRVLVRGAAGGVGAAAVQLAHASGARVTALARAGQTAALEGLGAAEILDYRTTRPDEIGEYDVIVDTVGTDLARYRRRLAPGGRMVTVALSGPAIAAIVASAIHGSRRIRTFSANPHSAELTKLAALVTTGALQPVIGNLYPLDDIAEAHRAFEKGGVLGRQIVQIK